MTETIRDELAAETRPHKLSREDLLLLLSRAAARGISVRPAVHRAEVAFTGLSRIGSGAGTGLLAA